MKSGSIEVKLVYEQVWADYRNVNQKCIKSKTVKRLQLDKLQLIKHRNNPITIIRKQYCPYGQATELVAPLKGWCFITLVNKEHN